MSLFQKLLLRSWWVILFTWVCYLFYEQGMRKWEIEHTKLHARLMELQDQKKKALALQEDLVYKLIAKAIRIG